MIIKIMIVIEDDDRLHRVLHFEEEFIKWMIERLKVPEDDIDTGIVANKTKNKIIRHIHIKNRPYKFVTQVRKLYEASGIKRVTIKEYADTGDSLQ